MLSDYILAAVFATSSAGLRIVPHLATPTPRCRGRHHHRHQHYRPRSRPHHHHCHRPRHALPPTLHEVPQKPGAADGGSPAGGGGGGGLIKCQGFRAGLSRAWRLSRHRLPAVEWRGSETEELERREDVYSAAWPDSSPFHP